MPDTLLLKGNEAVDWVLGRMRNTKWEKLPNTAEASIFQQVAAFHAAMSIKDSGDSYTEPQRAAAAAKNYESFAASAFLQFLRDEHDYNNFPPWLNQDIMGRNALGPASLLKAQQDGTKGKLYNPKEKTIWRWFTDACKAIRNEWNELYDSFLQGDQKNSGEQESDVMQAFHEALWNTMPQSQKKMKKKSGSGDGGAKAAEGGPEAAEAGATSSTAADGIAGQGVTEICVAVEMPVNWVHKYSLLFAFLGRPAGSECEYHCLALKAGSGPDEMEDGEEAGGDVKPAATGGGGLKNRGSIKALKKEGAKGAGIPAGRKQKRDEKDEDRKEKLRAKRDQKEDARTERLLAAIEKPQTSAVDLALLGYMQGLSTSQSREALRTAKAEIKEKREAEEKNLRDRIQLCADLGLADKEKAGKLALLLLLETPLPTPDVPAPRAVAPARAPPTANPPANALVPAALDLTDLTGGDESDGGGDSDPWEGINEGPFETGGLDSMAEPLTTTGAEAVVAPRTTLAEAFAKGAKRTEIETAAALPAVSTPTGAAAAGTAPAAASRAGGLLEIPAPAHFLAVDVASAASGVTLHGGPAPTAPPAALPGFSSGIATAGSAASRLVGGVAASGIPPAPPLEFSVAQKAAAAAAAAAVAAAEAADAKAAVAAAAAAARSAGSVGASRLVEKAIAAAAVAAAAEKAEAKAAVGVECAKGEGGGAETCGIISV